MRSDATRIFASGLTPVCVSDSHGEGSPTGHPYGTAARAANRSVVRGWTENIFKLILLLCLM